MIINPQDMKEFIKNVKNFSGNTVYLRTFYKTVLESNCQRFYQYCLEQYNQDSEFKRERLLETRLILDRLVNVSKNVQDSSIKDDINMMKELISMFTLDLLYIGINSLDCSINNLKGTTEKLYQYIQEYLSRNDIK